MRAGALLLIISMAMFGQEVNLSVLHRSCVPQAPMSTLAAIVHTESGGNPCALAIDFPNALLLHWKLSSGTLVLARQPHNQQEALDWIAYFERRGVSVDVGLMQVSTAEAQRRGIKLTTLIDPCTNLRVGWAILEGFYQLEMRHYGPGQTALVHSLSRYNTGDTQRGIANGYLGRVLASLRSLPAQEQQR
jgi:type IV secretion system protein VirB1